MQIAFHIGVNATDDERILRSLIRSSDRLTAAGVALPGPGRYRTLLRETIESMGNAAPPEGVRDILIDAITTMTDAKRMVLSNANFFSNHNRIFHGDIFYEQAAPRMRLLRQLFPQDELSVFMALRNPATFIPAAWGLSKHATLADFLGRIDPRSVRWSELIERMRDAAPDIALTIWANEDTPLLWSTILAHLAGDAVEAPFEGRHDLIETLMTPAGFRRLQTYLDSHPPASESQYRRVLSAFLDKYVIREEIEEEFDIPGWDIALITDLTNAYEAEIELIAGIEGVTFLQP